MTERVRKPARFRSFRRIIQKKEERKKEERRKKNHLEETNQTMKIIERF